MCWNYEIPGKENIDVFKKKEFLQFRMVLDSEMKRLQASGIGTTRRKADPLAFEEEEILWEKQILGGSTPQSLLNTMIYMNGLYFSLHGGKRNLCHNPSQIRLVEKPGERAYLEYREDLSKNRPGGLKGRKMQPKVVYHHANVDRPERCFVHFYKQYHSLCPSNCPNHAYYLRPLPEPEKECWYTDQPVGHINLKVL